ncbi:MAG: hypothetical protein EA398_07965 [Deltaproteobacteria bacterium]|nr:MAG: hypothetical protein EA398_07965 [Deltaproteobacteria bacterium]
MLIVLCSVAFAVEEEPEQLSDEAVDALMEEAAELLAGINSDVERVVAIEGEVRGSDPDLADSCVAPVLTTIRAIGRSAQQQVEAMSGLVQDGRSDQLSREMSSLSRLAAQAAGSRQEAERCLGEAEGVSDPVDGQTRSAEIDEPLDGADLDMEFDAVVDDDVVVDDRTPEATPFF